MENKESRLAYQGKVEALLKEWGSQIDRWQDELPANTQMFINDLNNKRQVVRSKLADMKAEGDERWSDFRFEMDQAIEEMKQTIDNLRARIEVR